MRVQAVAALAAFIGILLAQAPTMKIDDVMTVT